MRIKVAIIIIAMVTVCSRPTRCLRSRQTEPGSEVDIEALTQVPLGQQYSADEQCRNSFGPSSKFFREQYNGPRFNFEDDMCFNMRCQLPSGACEGTLPLEGTSCGNRKVCRPMSDSANLLNTQGGGSGGGGDRASLTSRGSFLLPPGGYPGERTPTSRLPSPAGTPSPGGKDPRSAPLTGALIMERLSKKMAYRPAKTTRMLVAISAVFVGSFLPFFIVVLIRGTHGRAFLGSLSDVEVVLVNLFIRSSFISNAVNPVIYGLCNKQFRTECRRLIGRCCNRKRDVNLPVFEQTDDVLASTNNYVK